MVFTDEEGQTLEYFDKVGEVSKEDFTSYIKDFTLSPNSSEKQQKEITNIEDTKREKLINEWIRDIQFYQPAYRYEEPFWKNEAFINQTRFADKKRSQAIWIKN
jgi:lipopolysaccharide export LptBFGC system permease protein LptF